MPSICQGQLLVLRAQFLRKDHEDTRGVLPFPHLYCFLSDNISPGNSYPFFNTQPQGDGENGSEGKALAVPA